MLGEVPMKKFKSSFLSYLYKNIDSESEESQFVLMMRFYYIITAIYIVAFDIFAFTVGILPKYFGLLVWLPLHVICFFTTYYCSRRVIFHIFSGGILGWLMVSVHLMGEDYGAHYFIYPLIVISFFATYKNFRGKMIYMMMLLTLNLSIYFYGKNHQPILEITQEQGHCLHIMYMVTLFICMFVICFMFSNTNQFALEKLKEYNRKLQKEAETDPLTGLMNRRCMYKALEDQMTNEQSVFSVAIGDIDFFKKINDSKGHNFGDAVLKEISAYFIDFMKDKGIVCRWGGEEFLFLFPSCGIEQTYAYMSEVRKGIEALPISYENNTISVTMTFGLEEYQKETVVTELISKADKKLYTGKICGRNTVVK